MKKRALFLLCLALAMVALIFGNSPAVAAEQTPAGVIDGDVLYKDLEVSRIFDERRESTLGQPSSSRGPFHFYDGLEVSCLAEKSSENGSLTEVVDVVVGTNLSLFSLNGVTLNKNRAGLIAAFGKPIEYYKYTGYEYRASDDKMVMRYHVTNFMFDYMIDFSFNHPDKESYIINIKRIGQ
ncbi:hypothetical protein LJC36_00895 [Desulfovibrio sp. OttesenSCG-928-C14]|nr:hypothetical protein [Desulfovibrio sp. OttesenSCG-928-C14]